MSKHKVTRNFNAEIDDEYDDYAENDEGMSQEDEVALRQGTADVARALGANINKVTQEQVRESLWYYYFDVDKTVAYLSKKYINPAELKAKTKERDGVSDDVPYDFDTTHFDRPHSEMNSTGSLLTVLEGNCLRCDPYRFERQKKTSYTRFFHDMPWLDVPVSRQTVFVPPLLPKTGLLGGAPPIKMSKLQALAAHRKRMAEDAKRAKENVAQEQTPHGEEEEKTELRTLKFPVRIGQSCQRINAEAMPQTISEQLEKPLSVQLPRLVDDKFEEKTPVLDFGRAEVKPSGQARSGGLEPSALAAEPSAFAVTLFGPKQKKLSEGQGTQLLTVPSLARVPPTAFDFTEPSPDDVILEAQEKAFKQTSTPKNKVTNKAASKPATKLNKADDTTLARSKNLDVLKEYEMSNSKKSASFVVAGHVDAGKSTMMGRLLLDLDCVDSRTVEKFRNEAKAIGKASFALAWVLDESSVERERGVTVDVATRHFETGKTAFTILDAPGHRDFIPNMIAGTSQADFAILVIDASTGAFESGLKGQTREHALLIRSLGVARIIVAVNKLDRVHWSKERYDEISQQVSGFLRATGFQLKNISFVPVSGLNGDNLVQRSTDPAAVWYTGPTLVEELDNSEPAVRALEKPLRIPVTAVNKTTGTTVTVSGRIEAGSLQVGDAMLAEPAAQKVFVKSMLRDGAPAGWAVAGQSVTLQLATADGGEPDILKAGHILCDIKSPAKCIDTFLAKVLTFDVLAPMPVEVVRGRLNAPAIIDSMTAILDKTTGVVIRRHPKAAKPGSVARVQIKLSSNQPLEPGQRVVLRSSGQTIAAGMIE